ncbi:hypothetical protein D0Z07_8276 [Hyphodiscus hymeniophilus]|uniref:Uncharacterized protein n=1 Tax=Hyphodiscus hymeniophilus TaxID=353542 RepID=A0A9P6VE34_9HELO|nr:hypothetical protein D0Z07_8276 [Hyphodiscus hymeniophilus]
MPSPTITDLENQFFDGAEFLEVEADEPLLPKAESADKNGSSKSSLRKSTRTRSSRYFRRVQETIELDDIPPIIKSTNGNIFWADEQCTRRVGLTSTEARLLLRLLQVDEPENFNWEDYKNMFDDFGREEARLRELVHQLPWWSLETYHQRPIWLARIEWLERMKEPRLWLLYLMARRRRILKQATERVRKRLVEKRDARLMGALKCANGNADRSKFDGIVGVEAPSPTMVNEESQTSEKEIATEAPVATARPAMTMVNEAAQTSDTLLNTARSRSRIKTNIAERIRLSFGSHHRESNSHSRSSAGRCPVFDRPFEATREDIKHQVELLMPKPTSYIVIGWFRRSAADPTERILQFDNEKELFQALRHGEHDVRGWREFFSLKSLKGFGLYKCDIGRGAHIPLILTSSQKAILSQFFLAYKASRRHSDDTVSRAWQGWVQKNLNDNKNNPLEGRYSVQLIYDWSSYRLTITFCVPLLLSLILGFWYMAKTGDVVTAWTISLYVVTAAAGSLKDI